MLDFGYYCMDCMDGMKQFPDKYFDLAVCDPPYGIGIESAGTRTNRYCKETNWRDNRPPDREYFAELFRVSKQQIIWGGNYFQLPPTKCFLIWDKKQPEGISFASCEFAWTSFDFPAKTFYMSPMNVKEKRFHVCQKPVALYEWIFNRYAKDGDIILDTHVGSGSSLIACRNTNHKYVGFELDEHYYKLSKERIDSETAQMNLYDFMGG